MSANDLFLCVRAEAKLRVYDTRVYSDHDPLHPVGVELCEFGTCTRIRLSSDELITLLPSALLERNWDERLPYVRPAGEWAHTPIMDAERTDHPPIPTPPQAATQDPTLATGDPGWRPTKGNLIWMALMALSLGMAGLALVISYADS